MVSEHLKSNEAWNQTGEALDMDEVSVSDALDWAFLRRLWVEPSDTGSPGSAAPCVNECARPVLTRTKKM